MQNKHRNRNLLPSDVTGSREREVGPPLSHSPPLFLPVQFRRRGTLSVEWVARGVPQFLPQINFGFTWPYCFDLIKIPPPARPRRMHSAVINGSDRVSTMSILSAEKFVRAPVRWILKNFYIVRCICRVK